MNLLLYTVACIVFLKFLHSCYHPFLFVHGWFMITAQRIDIKYECKHNIATIVQVNNQLQLLEVLLL